MSNNGHTPTQNMAFENRYLQDWTIITRGEEGPIR